MKKYHLILEVECFGDLEEYSIDIMVRGENELKASINFWATLVGANSARAILVA